MSWKLSLLLAPGPGQPNPDRTSSMIMTQSAGAANCGSDLRRLLNAASLASQSPAPSASALPRKAAVTMDGSQALSGRV